jgi:FtsP/CotA-like multicopper oxidase with cupredoxin domain
MSDKKLNRRNFIKLSSMALAGGYVGLKSGAALAQRMGGGGGGMGGGGGGGGMGGSVIDPPPGATFRNPEIMPVTRTQETIDGMLRNVATVDLEAKIAPVSVNGVLANLMTYNGYYPAPTIAAKKGELLRVRFTNSLPPTSQTNLLGHTRNVTNLHSHGWHVSPKSFMVDADDPDAPMIYQDYVMYDLHPGETCVHRYDTSLEEEGGFHFYHPHRHGVVAEQYWAGMVGALLTEDPTTNNPFSNMSTRIMILKDISLNGPDPAPHDTMMDYMHGKEGDTIMVNGQVNPVLPMRPGEVQRWRILNASNARWYKLSLSGHTMYLVGTDGHWLNKPYARSQILLSPGERVDILVKASATKGAYKFYSLPYSRRGNMTSAQITLLTMNVSGSALTAALPTSIKTGAQRLNVDTRTLPQRTLNLSMGQGQGYINGITFGSMDNAYTVMSEVGNLMMPPQDSYEVWTITNQSGMDHPFHQHVNPAQVLAINGADSSYPSYQTMPAWKDVVHIPKWGSATLLVPVKDFDGMSMFHCHILEHEDIGMMGVWHLMGPGMTDM